MANPAGTTAVPLSLFSSLVTEISAPDVPEGISPANNDVVYLPGSVSTRWGMNATLNTNGDAGPWSYEKSFVLPNGNIKNLYLSLSTGNLYVEDVTNNPANLTLLWASAGASYASSVTANGSEYIALSDGQHGIDIPLQYDGTNLWRITQDGPGTPPTVASVALPSSQMASSGNTLTRQNNQVLAQTATPHGLKVGYQAQISNVPDSNSTTVNQTMSGGPGVVAGDWQFVGNQFRTLFEPVTTALGDMTTQGFGFNIPSGATILGVIVSAFLVSQNHNTGTLSQVALWNNGAQLGTAKTPGTPFTTTDTQQAYGSAGDSWGAALTPAIVNSPTFGYSMAVNQPNNDRLFIGETFSITVYYTLSGSGTVAFIESIVINNETAPGQALVTTTQPHGLVPNVSVSIVGVEPGTVANISSAQWSAGKTTITTLTSHNLTPGSVVQINGVTTSTGGTSFSFDGTFTVDKVPSPDQITYYQTPITATDPDVINSTASTGAITVAWPIPDDTPTPTYFQVQSCPTPTTFYIPVTYSDGTWQTGTVGFIWEGTFYVTSVPSATSFYYQQYGPNGATTAVGTVTPWGQATPGIHLVQQSFLLQNGTITPPSPPAQFIANGGQYLQVDDLAIGPSSVQARILQFTGALGAFFFYIPVPAMVNGMVVSTATQVNDNTTTSILLDFSDNTLYGTGAAGNATGTAVSVPGNNLAAGNVLGPCAGVFAYSQRLLAWGNRNKVNGFLNLGFDGGYLTTPNSPSGWTGGGGLLIASRLGFAWQVPIAPTATLYGSLSQNAYANYYGAPIFVPGKEYSVRVWGKIAGTLAAPAISVTISSVSTGFSASVLLALNSATGQFVSGDFMQALPISLPSDLTLTVAASGASSDSTGFITIDDIEFYPEAQPYNQTEAWISYAGNFGGFDGLTGIIGANDDQSPIMNFGTLRKTLYIVTGTMVHETEDNGQTEPSSWDVDEVADNCGAYSIASVARNPQGIGSAGKTWMMWNGPDGAQIFTGEKPSKVSQEIQTYWDQIPQQNAYQCWTKNYEKQKWCLFGLPLAGGGMTTLVLDYRNMDSSQMEALAPIHISFTGKMIASDLTRKWSEWKLNAYSGELLYRQGNTTPQIALGIQSPANLAQSYTFTQGKFYDDDFGVTLLAAASYTTYFFVSHEMEQALQVGSHRKIYSLASAYISGVGTWTLAPNAAALGNIVPQVYGPWPLQANPGSDSPFGVNVTTTRCAFTVTAQSVVVNGTAQVYFKLQKLVINMAPDQNMPVGQIGAAF